MDILKNLFYGFPDLWGGGVAHSVLILALVITLGLSLGKLRVKGVSLGLAWILFIGLIFGHFSLNLDEKLLPTDICIVVNDFLMENFPNIMN